MLVHVGGDIMVDDGDIVAIIAIDTMEAAQVNRTLLDWAGDRREVIEVAGSRPRSCVVCTGAIYLSPISPATLWQRVVRRPTA